MKKLLIHELEKKYLLIKEFSISGKWIRLQDIYPLYNNLADFISVKKIGESEQQRSIYHLKLGNGNKRILIWSQMHGNESTGTKALFDMLNYFKVFVSDDFVKTILEQCTIEIIPMLNPDGAEVYTRVNANNVDLNRDAVDLQAKESKLLRSVLDKFKPQFCFNLHDQRTIFGVEGTKNPATISFLAPSEEITRKLTNGRKQTMNVINAMNTLLQQCISDQVGRYTDEFYPTATGDNFQKLGYNTILIEAGHYQNDYDREDVRKYNLFALLQGIYHIAVTDNFKDSYSDYFSIPNNIKIFYDVIHRSNKNKDVAFQYKEEIIEGTFIRSLVEEKQDDLSNFLGHKEILT